MSFYHGKPFVERIIMPAQKADICPPCGKAWRKDEDVRMIVEEPFDNKVNWSLMHIQCASEHPMNVNNMKDDVASVQTVEALDPWTYGTQRDALRFIMDYGTVIVEFDAHRPKGRQFRYQVYDQR